MPKYPLRLSGIRVVCFDWGGTLMDDHGPAELPMALWPSLKVLPGAVEALSLLHDQLPLYVASNASVSDEGMIALALRRAGLMRYLDGIFCAASLGYRKQQPEFWQAVTQRTGFDCSQIAMVGDSLEQDVLAPGRFGVQGVWLNREGRPAPEGVPMVGGLVEFARLLLGSGAPSQRISANEASNIARAPSKS